MLKIHSETFVDEMIQYLGFVSKFVSQEWDGWIQGISEETLFMNMNIWLIFEIAIWKRHRVYYFVGKRIHDSKQRHMTVNVLHSLWVERRSLVW